jgi:hypothetical protein
MERFFKWLCFAKNGFVWVSLAGWKRLKRGKNGLVLGSRQPNYASGVASVWLRRVSAGDQKSHPLDT